MAASARDLDLRQHHGVETPEHVDVQFELAGVGSRLAAGLLDLLLLSIGLFALWIGLGAIVGSLVASRGMARSWLSAAMIDRKSTRLNSSHPSISYAVFCLKKKNKYTTHT